MIVKGKESRIDSNAAFREAKEAEAYSINRKWIATKLPRSLQLV